MQQEGMRWDEVLTGFDAAVDWLLDDPFLADHEPPIRTDEPHWWLPNAEIAVLGLYR